MRKFPKGDAARDGRQSNGAVGDFCAMLAGLLLLSVGMSGCMRTESTAEVSYGPDSCMEGRPFVLDHEQAVGGLADAQFTTPNMFRMVPGGASGVLKTETGPGDQFAVPINAASQLDYYAAAWTTGNEITLIDTVGAAGFLFQSSAEDPLVFRLDAARGWVYLGGSGSIHLAGDEIVSLPYYEAPLRSEEEPSQQTPGDDEWRGRVDALWAVGCARPEGGATLAVDALNSEDWYVRRQAVRTLGHLQEATAGPLIRDLLNDENRTVRRAAAQALGKIGDMAAAPELQERFRDDSDLLVRIRAAVALARIGDPSIGERLRALLRSEERDQRFLAATALGLLADIEAAAALTEAMAAEEDTFVEAALTRAVRRIDTYSGR